MRPASTTAAVIVAGIFALLLIAYVFLGGSSGRADAAPHCTSQQALAQVKAELFRRAAAIRGTNDPAFQTLENSSVVLAASRLERRHHGASSRVSCSGSLVLELPPGAAVVGGRQRLSANLAYDLEGQSGGGAQLLSLSNADTIAVPLASVGNAGALTGAAPQPNPPPAQTAPPLPPAPPPVPVARPAPPPPPVQAAPRPAQVPRGPAPPPPPPKKAAPKPAPEPGPKPAARPLAPARPPQPVAVAKPSFNCRYARTRGEIAVCSDLGLASLDRQMSTEFYRALAAARPGQRAMLERSRNRFLRYRDSCGSQACIADAYRGRMREIADIMSGNW